MTIRSRDKVLLVINFSYVLHILCLIGVIFALIVPKKNLNIHRRLVVLVIGFVSIYYNRGMYENLFGDNSSSSANVNVVKPSMGNSPASTTTTTTTVSEGLDEAYKILGTYSDKHMENHVQIEEESKGDKNDVKFVEINVDETDENEF